MVHLFSSGGFLFIVMLFRHRAESYHENYPSILCILYKYQATWPALCEYELFLSAIIIQPHAIKAISCWVPFSEEKLPSLVQLLKFLSSHFPAHSLSNNTPPLVEHSLITTNSAGEPTTRHVWERVCGCVGAKAYPLLYNLHPEQKKNDM